MITETKAVERLPGRCPHCGGTFMVDEDGNKCTACSRVVKGNITKGLYYEYNKDAILADIKLIGRRDTSRKWKIPQGSFSRLLTRWSKNGAYDLAPAGRKSRAAGPFGLPAWSDSWGTELQLKWLDIFLYLKIKDEGG